MYTYENFTSATYGNVFVATTHEVSLDYVIMLRYYYWKSNIKVIIWLAPTHKKGKRAERGIFN